MVDLLVFFPTASVVMMVESEANGVAGPEIGRFNPRCLQGQTHSRGWAGASADTSRSFPVEGVFGPPRGFLSFLDDEPVGNLSFRVVATAGHDLFRWLCLMGGTNTGRKRTTVRLPNPLPQGGLAVYPSVHIQFILLGLSPPSYLIILSSPLLTTAPPRVFNWRLPSLTLRSVFVLVCRCCQAASSS
jgi:hypothetical protein